MIPQSARFSTALRKLLERRLGERPKVLKQALRFAKAPIFQNVIKELDAVYLVNMRLRDLERYGDLHLGSDGWVVGRTGERLRLRVLYLSDSNGDSFESNAAWHLHSEVISVGAVSDVMRVLADAESISAQRIMLGVFHEMWHALEFLRGVGVKLRGRPLSLQETIDATLDPESRTRLAEQSFAREIGVRSAAPRGVAREDTVENALAKLASERKPYIARSVKSSAPRMTYLEGAVVSFLRAEFGDILVVGEKMDVERAIDRALQEAPGYLALRSVRGGAIDEGDATGPNLVAPLRTLDDYGEAIWRAGIFVGRERKAVEILYGQVHLATKVLGNRWDQLARRLAAGEFATGTDYFNAHSQLAEEHLRVIFDLEVEYPPLD
jgi:hypothetical protein